MSAPIPAEKRFLMGCGINNFPIFRSLNWLATVITGETESTVYAAEKGIRGRGRPALFSDQHVGLFEVDLALQENSLLN